jgi:hypothetical protein
VRLCKPPQILYLDYCSPYVRHPKPSKTLHVNPPFLAGSTISPGKRSTDWSLNVILRTILVNERIEPCWYCLNQIELQMPDVACFRTNPCSRSVLCLCSPYSFTVVANRTASGSPCDITATIILEDYGELPERKHVWSIFWRASNELPYRNRYATFPHIRRHVELFGGLAACSARCRKHIVLFDFVYDT